MYVIVTDVMGDRMYLAWNHANDGYFWTSEENFRECLPQNGSNHKFAFYNHYIATYWLLHKCDIPKCWKAHIIKLEGI